MKRMRMWLRELSLAQQLLVIIFMFLIILAGFIALFLSPAIDRVSENEMYRILHDSQESILHYDESHDNDVLYYAPTSDSSVTDAIYDAKSDTFQMLAGDEIAKEIQEDIRKQIQNPIEGMQDYKYELRKEGMRSRDSEVYLYCLTPLSGERYAVSILAEEFFSQFRQSLTSGLVISNILFSSVLFGLLMLWVTTLIIPLSQIKSYINKLQNDEPHNALNIRRNDEIGEVAEALQEMESALARQSREKEEMIQNISHDLKTPVATIKSYSEAIKDGIYPYETLEKSVDVIYEHADRLEKKVESLIVLNKMGYLKDDESDEENLLMNEVIDKVLLSLKVIRPEIEFVTEMDEDVYFHGEEEPWRIVVENLVDNALRYAKTNVTITLKPQELCVINDGDPIPLDRMNSLFKPYEKGTDGKFGLGLSIVYRVTSTYHYRVSAENLSDGVCFRIYKDDKKKSNKKKKSGSA